MIALAVALLLLTGASSALADGSGWSIDSDVAIPDDCDGRFVERCSEWPEVESEEQDTDDVDEDEDEDD
jgi:hypothetical protein